MTLHQVFDRDVQSSADTDYDAVRPPPLPRRSAQPRWTRLDRTSRLLAAGVGALGVGVFVLAAVLSPYANDGMPLTHGTHRQLGLPACHVQSLLGMPCPSCGMTTSVSLCMHGDVAAALRVNWAGVVVTVLGVVTTGWLCAIAGAGWCPHWLKPDQVVQWLAIAGASSAVLRYLGLAGARLLG